MAARKRKPDREPVVPSIDVRTAYAICRAVYLGHPCGCEVARGGPCENMKRAAARAKARLSEAEN